MLDNEFELDFNGFFRGIVDPQSNISMSSSWKYHGAPLVTEAAELGRKLCVTERRLESLKSVEVHGRYHPIR